MELLGFDIFTHYCHYHQLIDMICFSEHRELRTVCLLRVPKPPFQRALSPLSVCDILKGFFAYSCKLYSLLLPSRSSLSFHFHYSVSDQSFTALPKTRIWV